MNDRTKDENWCSTCHGNGSFTAPYDGNCPEPHGRERLRSLQGERPTGDYKRAEAIASKDSRSESPAPILPTSKQRCQHGISMDAYPPCHFCGHEQYVEWVSPQLERLGHEIADNARLRAALEEVRGCISHQDFMRVRRVVSAALDGDSRPVETTDPQYRKWPGEPPHCMSCDCGMTEEQKALAARTVPLEDHLRVHRELMNLKYPGSSPEEPKEPPDPTPEMIMQGIWAWQRDERFNTAEDVRAIYIAMRRMEGRSAKETLARPTQRVVNAAGTAAYDIPQYVEVNEDGSLPVNGNGDDV